MDSLLINARLSVERAVKHCHGPGEMHFETEGNCIISMTGRYGESVEQRNDVCLGCHQSGERMHWLSSTHEAEDLVCVSCHSIHKPNDVIDRTSQAEVCYKCHKDIRSQTFRASSHPIRDNKVYAVIVIILTDLQDLSL